MSFLLVQALCYSQTGLLPYENGRVYYSEVVRLDSSYSKNNLFDNALILIADATNGYNNTLANRKTWELKDNTKISNRDSGELLATIRFYVGQKYNTWIVSCDMFMYVKDGRYKYVITNFYLLVSSLANSVAGGQFPSIIQSKETIYQNSKSLLPNSLRNGQKRSGRTQKDGI